MIKNPRIIVLLFTLLAMIFVFYKLFIEKKGTLEYTNKSKDEIQLADKSVPAAERFIKQIIKDSTSYQSIGWTDLVDRDSIYYVSNTFKSKNESSEYVVETYGFRLGKNGNVLGFDILANKP